MPRRLTHLGVLLGLVAGLGACTALPPVPAVAPDPVAAQARWVDARPHDAAAREALRQQGVAVDAWPLPAWSLPALSALALSRDAELAAARADWREAQARRAASGLPPGAEWTLERRMAESGGSPWTLGVALQFVQAGDERLRSEAAESAARADQALLRVAERAWAVHRRVRGAWQAVKHRRAWAEHAAQRLAWAEAGAQAAERRLALGVADRAEVQASQQALRSAQAAVARALADRSAAEALLAAALALPAESVAGLPLAPATPGAPPPTPLAAQREALRHRLDLHAALSAHAAAEAALRLEAARRTPALTWQPGLAWDQGAWRWSLGMGVHWPPTPGNTVALGAAQARRDAEVARVLAVQADALSALDTALAGLGPAASAHSAAQAGVLGADAAAAMARRQMEAGAGDRLAWLAAWAQQLEAEAALLDAQAAEAEARAALEDALQRPLDGSPWPAPATLVQR